jgi:outer membrane protein OmpA-like peptidoglycan-associated protein
MHYRIAVALLMILLAGCVGGDGGKFTVFFGPYSSQLDAKAQETIQAAATFAKGNPLMPVSVQGDNTQPDPTEFDTLRQLRVAAVKNGLVKAGVGDLRIQIMGSGINYPQGVPMPALSPGQVLINVGL